MKVADVDANVRQAANWIRDNPTVPERARSARGIGDRAADDFLVAPEKPSSQSFDKKVPNWFIWVIQRAVAACTMFSVLGD
jgi:hypothetical protein